MSNNSIEQLMTISLRHISKESETLLFQNGKAEGDYVYCMLAFYNPTAHRYFVLTNWDEELVPADLDACLTYAHDKGFEWVTFTEGVEPIKDLPLLRTEGEIYREWSDIKNDI